MRSIALILSIGALALCACGTAGDPHPNLFVGPYRKLVLDARYVPAYQRDSVGITWGEYDSDGSGEITTVTNFIAGDVIESAGSYVLDADRRLEVTRGTWREEGGLDPLGRVAVTHEFHSFEDVVISVLLSRIGAFDDGTLAGTYHLAGAGRRQWSGRGFHALFGSRLTFDGAGGYTATPVTLNDGGLLFEETAAEGLTYHVASDGDLSMVDHLGLDDMLGGVLPGGEMAVAVGGLTVDEHVAFHVLVRESSGLSDDTLNGDYWAVEIEHTADGFRSVSGTLTADGEGSFELTGSENHNGVEGVADPLTGTYAVASDGALTLTVGGDEILEGGITRDGQFLTVAGGTAEGDVPRFVVAVAKEYGVSR